MAGDLSKLSMSFSKKIPYLQFLIYWKQQMDNWTNCNRFAGFVLVIIDLTILTILDWLIDWNSSTLYIKFCTFLKRTICFWYFQSIRANYSIIFRVLTRLWTSLPLRLSKRQSTTTVLFRTTLTRTITQYELLILLGSNHLLCYKVYKAQ